MDEIKMVERMFVEPLPSKDATVAGRDRLVRLARSEARETSGDAETLVRALSMGDSAGTAGTRTRRRIVLAAAGTVAAGVSIALAVPMISGAGGPRANAVVQDPDGSIRLYFRDTKHPEVIAAKLKGMGVKAVVDFVPNGMRCKTPRGRMRTVPRGLLALAPPDDDGNGPFSRLHPEKIKAGETLVLEVSFARFGNGSSADRFGWGLATGPVAPCVLEPGEPQMIQLPDGGIGG